MKDAFIGTLDDQNFV